MSINVNSYLNSSLLSSMLGTGSSSSSSSIFDVSSAQSNAEVMLAAALGTTTGSSATSSADSLKKETAQFLDGYVLQMKELSQSTESLKYGGIDKLLYDAEGNVTEETIAATVKAVQSMVDEYNATLDFLNDNGERGPGVTAQLEKMARGMMAEQGLELVGLSIGSDASLVLDTTVLTEALGSENEAALSLTKDLLGGVGGLADKIDRFANNAVNVSAASLIQNDLAEIQSLQSSATGTYTSLLQTAKSGAYTLNNIAFLNMLDTQV